MIEELKTFFNNNLGKKINGIGVFVYNGYNTYSSSDPHIEECFDKYEAQEVYDAFDEIFEEVLLYPSEESFISSLNYLKNKTVYVYTMAQFTKGYARRALVPALCEYYGFTNINADTYTSVIGVNKKTTFALLPQFDKYFPKTDYISKENISDLYALLKNHSKRIIIKPDCESCCIDVEVFDKSDFDGVFCHCSKLIQKYKFLILQDFIEGREVGLTLVNFENNFVALQPIEIKYKTYKDYLTNIDSRYTNLDFVFSDIDSKIKNTAIQIAKILEFTGISRFDFRICDDGSYYLFDISPNPTLSGGSSCNLAFINAVDGNYKSIYQFLAFNSLLKPSLNTAEHN